MRFAVFLAMAAAGHGAAPAIATYSAEVRRESPAQYEIKVKATVRGGAWSKPSFTLGPFAGATFQGCVMCEVRPLGVLLRLTPMAGFEVTYRIAAVAAGERQSIPLAVPELAGTGDAGSVRISIHPGENITLPGDMFPILNVDSTGQWIAIMANVVNHVEFRVAGKGLGPRLWSDIAVVLMIAGGLLVRAAIVRRAGAR